jgi:sugar phosphate isomerase/epimerase
VYAMRNDQIAVQLYTVRDLAARDLPGTLGQVASAGYRAVEVAGLPAVAPAVLRTMLDDAGLQVIAAHHSLADFRRDRDGSLDALAAIGAPRAIVPWLAEEDRASSAAVRAVAKELAGIADAAASRGIGLGYHNHAFEFDPIDGTTTWDVLLDALPPSIEIELDVYWAAFAGRDPAALLADLGSRVRLLHMKDMAHGPTRQDAAPGDGVLPWDAIVAAAGRAGVEWYIVEQDNPGDDPIGAIGRGLDYLRGMAAMAAS